MSWPTVPLGELVTTRGGGTPSKANVSYYGGSIPWITPKDMKTRELSSSQVMLTPAGLANSSAQLIPVNSVLVVTRSGVLKHSLPVAVNRVPAAINQDMRALIPSPSVDADFLALLLAAKAPVILRWVRATTADNFPFNRLLGLPVPLPPLDEQRRLARILDAADRLRQRRSTTIELLELLQQRLLHAWLQDDHNSSKLVELVTATALVTKGTTPTSIGLSYADNGIRFLRAQDLVGGTVGPRRDDALFIDATTDRALQRSRIQPGDVLLSIAGTIGRVAVVADGADPMNCNQAVAIIRCTKVLRPRFLRAALAIPNVRRQISGAAVTGTITNLSLAQIRGLRIPLPSVSLQRAFESRSEVVERQMNRSSAQLAELEALFISLRHRAFAGAL